MRALRWRRPRDEVGDAFFDALSFVGLGEFMGKSVPAEAPPSAFAEFDEEQECVPESSFIRSPFNLDTQRDGPDLRKVSGHLSDVIHDVHNVSVACVRAPQAQMQSVLPQLWQGVMRVSSRRSCSENVGGGIASVFIGSPDWWLHSLDAAEDVLATAGQTALVWGWRARTLPPISVLEGSNSGTI